MKKIIVLFLLSVGLTIAQDYTVTKVSGDVKYQSGGNENWVNLKKSETIELDAVISTGDNSSITLRSNNLHFILNESSAISVSSIKKMSTDELLLALAMEDIINAPKNNSNGKSGNTAVYGTDESNSDELNIIAGNFGIKRLNGAKQLAANGMKESAVVVAKETFRKYPDTKSISSYRIFFADILFEKGLYTEAFEEFNEIADLELSDEEKAKIDEKTETIKKILLNN
ncbi:MAG: hypothetical protein HKM87_10005 [Ignavibacteriaceae bacterium]|nr:hypothetical protein [Ignavibacteriaceae bacterium]